jgi:hypothetical protein
MPRCSAVQLSRRSVAHGGRAAGLGGLATLGALGALGALAASAGCGAAPERAAVAAACSPARIGAVRVDGAARTDVPALAVLEGTLDDRARLARVAAVAVRALQARGFARATLEVTHERGCFLDLRVRVVLGPRYRIAEIAFLSEDELPAAERLAAIEDALGTVNAVGGVYVADRLERALPALAGRYREAGWLDARIGDPRVTYGGDGSVRLAIPVTPGPRYRVATVRARGASPRARRAALDELGIAPGSYYDAGAVRSGLARARRALDPRVALQTRIAGTAALELELELPGAGQPRRAPRAAVVTSRGAPGGTAR